MKKNAHHLFLIITMMIVEILKSDNSKSSSHPPSPIVLFPVTFGAFDPLTLSIIERQRLLSGYASLFNATSQSNNFFPGNFDPTTFRNNGSSNIFPKLGSTPSISTAT